MATVDRCELMCNIVQLICIVIIVQDNMDNTDLHPFGYQEYHYHPILSYIAQPIPRDSCPACLRSFWGDLALAHVGLSLNNCSMSPHCHHCATVQDHGPPNCYDVAGSGVRRLTVFSANSLEILPGSHIGHRSVTSINSATSRWSGLSPKRVGPLCQVLGWTKDGRTISWKPNRVKPIVVARGTSWAWRWWTTSRHEGLDLPAVHRSARSPHLHRKKMRKNLEQDLEFGFVLAIWLWVHTWRPSAVLGKQVLTHPYFLLQAMDESL